MKKLLRSVRLTPNAVQSLSKVVEAIQMDPQLRGYVEVGDVVSAAIVAFQGQQADERRKWMMVVRDEVGDQGED